MLTSRQKRRAALLKCCVRLTLLRGPEVRRLPGRSPPIALRHLRYGVSSRLRSRRTTFLVSPGPGTEHRGMRTDLRGPAATAHCLTCGRWSHSRYLLCARGQAPQVVKIHPPVCGLPALAEVCALGESAAPGLVQEFGGSGVGEQGMAVGLGTRPLVLPGLAAVGAPHHPAKLYAGHD